MGKMRVGCVLFCLLLLVSLAYAQLQDSLEADYVNRFGEVYTFDLVGRCYVDVIKGTYEYYKVRCLEEQKEYIEVWYACYYSDGGKPEYRGRIMMGAEAIQ